VVEVHGFLWRRGTGRDSAGTFNTIIIYWVSLTLARDLISTDLVFSSGTGESRESGRIVPRYHAQTVDQMDSLKLLSHCTCNQAGPKFGFL
jgi:hypothetical protein